MADISIYTIEDLASINSGSGARTGTHTLMRNLDFNDDNSYANPANKTTYTTGSGWTPLGPLGNGYYAGTFNGQGFTISNLYIKDRNAAGLFGVIDTCTIRDLGVINASVNVATTGNYTEAGALIGGIDPEGTVLIENCYTQGGNVGCDDHAGGFMGICHMYATANVTVRNCYSTTAVTERGSLQDGFGIGGFVGTLNKVSGGGSITFTNCYASGAVTSGNPAQSSGGWSGFYDASTSMTFNNCYYNSTTTGYGTSANGTAKTNTQMIALSTFSGIYDISAETAYNYPTKWFMRDGVYQPKLLIEYKRYDTSGFIGS